MYTSLRQSLHLALSIDRTPTTSDDKMGIFVLDLVGVAEFMLLYALASYAHAVDEYSCPGNVLIPVFELRM